MDEDARESLAESVLERSAADKTEVLVRATSEALTRFARGVTSQNVASSDCTISVRAIVGNRTGVASGNRLDPTALDELVARAVKMASFAPIDALEHDLPRVSRYDAAPPHAYVAATANADSLVRADIAGTMIEGVRSAGYWSSGYVSSSATGITVANDGGVCASFDGTNAAANLKVTAADSTGFAEQYSNDIAVIGGRDIADRAIDKARASAAPRGVEPGDWTVILEPAAFGELLAYLSSHFSAQSYDEGSSFLCGRLGEKMFPENLTIRDDHANALAPGMPFDYEGQPKERLALIEGGVARHIVTDSYYAKKLGMRNTGHALPAPNAVGPYPLNISVDAGTAGVDELIAQTARGLLITRFWYIRTVDQKRAIVTGMTRDGTFLIEDGRVVSGARNLRFNHSIVEALANASFGRDLQRTGGYSYSITVPAVKIEGFRFTSSTQF